MVSIEALRARASYSSSLSPYGYIDRRKSNIYSPQSAPKTLTELGSGIPLPLKSDIFVPLVLTHLGRDRKVAKAHQQSSYNSSKGGIVESFGQISHNPDPKKRQWFFTRIGLIFGHHEKLRIHFFKLH